MKAFLNRKPSMLVSAPPPGWSRPRGRLGSATTGFTERAKGLTVFHDVQVPHALVPLHVPLVIACFGKAGPGALRRCLGPAVQAVQEGRWLLIEDLDRAPPDVAAALVPLLESRKLPLPHRGQSLRAAPGFQLLASITKTHSRGFLLYAFYPFVPALYHIVQEGRN